MNNITVFEEHELLSNWFVDEPLISIVCTSYNHELFIRDALNGFFGQITKYPFEVIIHDDASTDDTQEIIKQYVDKYPKIITPILQLENQWMGKGISGTTKFAFPAARGKYIAWCEGDDYWTDPFKLQKQVDFLENNSEFSLVGHWAVNSNNKTIGVFDKDDFAFEDIYFRTLSIPTASIVFRNIVEIPNWVSSIYGLDKAMIFLCASIGKLKVLHFIGSFYRLHSGSMEHQYKDDLKKSIRNINEHIVYYNLTKHLPKSTVLRKKIIKNHVDIILYCIYTFRFSYLIKAPYSLFLFLTRGRIYIK
jgi:glycosyltransferase involved in cell wall biosynthesis